MQASATDLNVLDISLISEEIRRLGVISCDICGVEKASHDVFVNGVVKDIPVLKRCCDNCIKSLNR